MSVLSDCTVERTFLSSSVALSLLMFCDAFWLCLSSTAAAAAAAAVNAY